MRITFIIALILSAAGLISSCTSQPKAVDVINIISYESQMASSALASSDIPDDKGASESSADVSSRRVPAQTSSKRDTASKSAVSSKTILSSRTSSVSISSAASAPSTVSSQPENLVNIADENLRRYLNKTYFDRENSAVQPSLAEMQSLKQISIGENCGIKTLEGIESAENLEKIKISFNALGDLSLVNFEKLTHLKSVIFDDTDITSLRNINWKPESIEYLSVSSAEAKGKLNDIDIPWERYSALVTLNLNNNALTDLSPLKAPMKSLKTLYINGNLNKEDSFAFFNEYRRLYPNVKVYWQ